MKFEIDFFELMFLAEACIPPKPIARATFWDDLCDKHYYKMSADQRKKVYTWLKDKLNLKEEDSKYFLARFNPDNQYIVTTVLDGEIEAIKCFYNAGKYHINKTCTINNEYITEINKKI